MAPRSPHFRDVVSAEQRFGQLVESFIHSHDPRVQPTIARIAACWAKEWVNLASPTLFPPRGAAFGELLGEARSEYMHLYYQENRERMQKQHREYYQANREKLLAQQKEYRQRQRKTWGTRGAYASH